MKHGAGVRVDGEAACQSSASQGGRRWGQLHVPSFIGGIGPGRPRRNPCPAPTPRSRRVSSSASGLDPLGDDLHLDLLRERSQSRDEGALVVVAIDATHEAPVELQQIRGEFDHMRESGETTPDVVDRESRTEVAEFGQTRPRPFVVHDRRSLRELDHHPSCRDRPQCLCQTRFAERLRRDVHREIHVAGDLFEVVERVLRGGEFESRQLALTRRLGEPGLGRSSGLRQESGKRLHAEDAAVVEIDDGLEHRVEHVSADRCLDPLGGDPHRLRDPDHVTGLLLGQPLGHLAQSIDRDARASGDRPVDRSEDLIGRLVLAHVSHGACMNHRCDGSRIRARRQGDDAGLG